MLIGSEGILGAIAEAWVRVRPRPEFKASRGVEFGNFMAAAAAVREIAQSGLHPANCRLLDASEAELTGAGDGSANLLILGFESAHHPVDAAMDVALEIARAHGGTPNSRRRAETGTKSPEIGPSAVRMAARSRLGGGRSCWRRTCATRSSLAGCFRRPLRRQSPGTALRSSMRA